MKLVEVFERIGLVEISEGQKREKEQVPTEVPPPESIDRILEEEEVIGFDDSSALGVESASAMGSAEIEENRPFDEIYAAAGIAESPFSADKLLKLLDALGSLPEETRKQAVVAMDAAEDSWTIEDPLLDAQRRIRALENERKRLGEQADLAEAQAAKELEEQKQYEEQAVAQIRKQIAELEALMEREMHSVAETRERIKASSKSGREACQREQNRLEKEIGRLQQIERMFSVETGQAKPKNNNHPSGKTNG